MYEKLNLTEGDVLSDFHINHLQEGILNIEKDAKRFRQSLIKILEAKGISCSEDESFDTLSQKVNLLNGAYVPNDEEGEEPQGLIDIRKEVKSGQVKLLFTNIQHGMADITFWTRDNSQYMVDWGDGSHNIYNSGEKATHQYENGVGGHPYGEANTQWVATVSCQGNQLCSKCR